MILSKKSLEEYLDADAKKYKSYNYFIKFIVPFAISEEHIRLRYCMRLRKTEYYKNTNKRIKYAVSKFLLNRMQIQTGIIIPPNTVGKGLSIGHIGTIIINGKCKIGDNLKIHADVNIGANGGMPPVIGDNCYIGPGAKIFGDIRISNNVFIGAGAVVNKDCTQEFGVYAGVPAKLVSTRNNQECKSENFSY